MTVMRGPVNPSMNDECGFLLEGFDKPPVAMMTYTPPYYLELAEQYGFKKAKDLYALIKTLKDGVPARMERIIEKIKKNTAVRLRPLDMKNFGRDIQYLKDIYNSAWEKNWGFVPMTSEEMDLAAEKLKQFVKPELVLFAEINGKPIGVAVSIPDINQVLSKINGKLGPVGIFKFLYYRNKIDGIRALLGGVKKEYRNTGIISVLYYETEKAALRLGYKWCELGWNLEDNDLINKFDEAIGGKVYKKYRICEIDL
jgi:GNAT superfamily N-acetyltransferase